MQDIHVICELVVVTYDIGPSLSPFVSKVVKMIRDDTSVTHQLCPMGSVIEGDWKDVMRLVDRIMIAFAPDYERIGITLKVDYRRSKRDRIEGKVRSVEEKMNSIDE